MLIEVAEVSALDAWLVEADWRGAVFLAAGMIATGLLYAIVTVLVSWIKTHVAREGGEDARI